MPIWPVSFVDGIYQVADADGALYPITMQGNSVSQFNPGWAPRGLQTGLAPFHILELTHDTGINTFWLLDSGLDFRGNAIVHLPGPDRALFFAHVEPLVRTLFDESVKARHSAIPAGAHEFDGFQPESVRELIVEAVDRTIGRPDAVPFHNPDEIGAYERNGLVLSPSWIAQALRPVAAPQERLDLPDRTALRYFDQSLGLVSYVLEGPAPDDRQLYVPAASVIFSTGAAPDPLWLLTQLMVWYATHTDRAVMLPEAEGLEPGLVHVKAPPQHGLDEPVAMPEADEAPRDPVSLPASQPVLEPALDHAMLASAAADPTPVARPSRREPAASYREPMAAAPTRAEPIGLPARAEPARPSTPMPPPRQNWWQRLLGLGHG